MPQTSNNTAKLTCSEGFDLATMIEIARQGRLDRLAFSAIYAAFDLRADKVHEINPERVGRHRALPRVACAGDLSCAALRDATAQ